MWTALRFAYPKIAHYALRLVVHHPFLTDGKGNVDDAQWLMEIFREAFSGLTYEVTTWVNSDLLGLVLQTGAAAIDLPHRE